MRFTLARQCSSLALLLGLSFGGYHFAQEHHSGPSNFWNEKPLPQDPNCAPTIEVNGHTCVFLNGECNKEGTVCACSYDCAGDGAGPSVPVGQTDFSGFDNLPENVQRATLSRDGPLLPPRINTNDLAMRVLLRGKWPFYISYSLIKGSAVLTITANGIEPFSLELNVGEKVKKLFEVPERFGGVLSVAKISIKAESDSQLDLHAIGILERVKNNHRSSYRIPAGAREPIADVTATPNKIRTERQEKISYWFFSRTLYSSGEAEFFLYKVNSKNEIVPSRVYSSHYENIKANEKTEIQQWDGKNRKGQFSFGIYRLQIRTWRGQENGGEWFGPYFGPKVEVIP